MVSKAIATDRRKMVISRKWAALIGCCFGLVVALTTVVIMQEAVIQFSVAIKYSYYLAESVFKSQ